MATNNLINNSPSKIQIDTYTGGTNTWTKPSGVKQVEVICIGGGGGGGRGYRNITSISTPRSGGGGGACSCCFCSA